MCEQDGIHYITGVLTWVDSNKPVVYSNVHRYVNWINETMSNGQSNDHDYDYQDL